MTLDTFCPECDKRFATTNKKAIKNFLEKGIKVVCPECSKRAESQCEYDKNIDWDL